MATPKFADRVVETTQTTGTGTLDLDGASTGFRTFVEGLGDGTLVAYVITDGVEWETGSGTVTDATPDTLSRTTVSASSNGGAKVNWTNDNKNERDVFCAPIAEFISAFESGTVMLFHQLAAPSGWTKDVAAALDDSALRIVTSTTWVSGQGGATVFSSVFGSSKNAGAMKLSGPQTGTVAHSHGGGSYSAGSNGAHQHGMDLSNAASGSFTAGDHLDGVGSLWGTGTGSGSNVEVGIRSVSDHTHPMSGTSGATTAASAVTSHAHTLSLDLNFVNFILASKD